MIAFIVNQTCSCRYTIKIVESFLSLTVKVHGSYVKKATTEAPMDVLFTKIEAAAARTLRVWKRHT